jgi:anthranilate synthase/aminodeoxychorismate synthase-like glutamine amidotransferase
MILLIDNYDSFVHNLARYFQRLGQQVEVVRNTTIDVAGVRERQPAAVVFSPGPCTPNEAGNSLEIVRQLHGELPMLGVCLGHQTIVQAFGGVIVQAAEPMHGRSSAVLHDGRGIFAGLPSPLIAGRYHSLMADAASLPACLRVAARTTDGTIMAVEHQSLPIVGVQFHPESILTEHGFALLAGFLRLAGLPCPAELPGGELHFP